MIKKLSILFFLIVPIDMVSACTSYDARHESAHFKEGLFQNINPVKMHSFWTMLWSWLTSDDERADWPDWVETQEDTSPLEEVAGNATRITFVNHATFLIQSAGYNILIDPVFSKRTSPLSFVGSKRVHKPGIAFKDLPKIDVIIISHDHYDHLDLASINGLIKRDNPKVFVGLGVKRRLADSSNTVELDWWQSADITDDFKLWFLDVHS